MGGGRAGGVPLSIFRFIRLAGKDTDTGSGTGTGAGTVVWPERAETVGERRSDRSRTPPSLLGVRSERNFQKISRKLGSELREIVSGNKVVTVWKLPSSPREST